MSVAFNVIKTTGVTGAQYSSVIGRKAPKKEPIEKGAKTKGGEAL